MFYSKSTRGFYETDAPSDTVHISEEIYSLLLQKQSKGFEVSPDENGFPKANPPQPSTPSVVTMYQARAILIEDNLIDDVEASITEMPDGKEKRKAQAAWEYAATVDRDSPFTQMLAEALSLTESQLDSLFVRASEVK